MSVHGSPLPHTLYYRVKDKGKSVPLQVSTGPEGSRKLRLPDFVTTAQAGGRLSALHPDRLYPQEILLVLIYVWERGSTVVKVLCYNSEGRWFDPSWCHWNFSLT